MLFGVSNGMHDTLTDTHITSQDQNKNETKEFLIIRYIWSEYVIRYGACRKCYKTYGDSHLIRKTMLRG